MSYTTPEQQQQLGALIARAIATAGPPEAVAAPELAATATDPKALFCENWPTVKSVLQFLAGLSVMPEYLKVAINSLIRIGDGARAILCPGH